MPATDPRRLGPSLMASAIVLALGAVFVRGIAPPRSGMRGASWGAGPHLEKPVQLLSPGATHRRGELDERVSLGLVDAWREAQELAFGLEGCPGLRDWLEEPDGQRVELLVGKLRAGGPGDALAALTVVFQVARRAEWTPGFPAHAEHAERLGGLLAGWLARWGEASVDDPGLHETALVAALFYGRVMETAWLERVKHITIGDFSQQEMGFPPAGLDFAVSTTLWTAGFTLCAVGLWLRNEAAREVEVERIHALVEILPPAAALVVTRLVPESEWERLGLFGLSEWRLARRMEQLVSERVQSQLQLEAAFRGMQLAPAVTGEGITASIQQALAGYAASSSPRLLSEPGEAGEASQEEG